MLFLQLLAISLSIFSNADPTLASPHSPARAAPAPRPRFLQKAGRRAAAELYNPLIAKRQVRAESIRSPPRKAKRACPSFLPNGNCGCPSETTYCGGRDDDDSDGFCVNLNTDTQNCGECGYVCPAGADCESGYCFCPVDERVCSGACTNTSTDTNHCGRCNIACDPGLLCLNGVCGCEPGFIECNGVCHDPSSDSRNCGGCGTSCGSGSCVDGVCNYPRVGLIAAIATNDASHHVVCYFDGTLCEPTPSGAWTGTVGVSEQGLYTDASSGKFFVFPIHPDGPTVLGGAESTGDGDITANFISETGAGATPGNYGGASYETDLWAISDSPVQTSGGTAYPLSAIWVNPSNSPTELVWFLMPYARYPGSFVIGFSGSYTSHNSNYQAVNLYFIPAS